MRRAVLGLTLIELVAALAVFAILGTLTYRGTTQLLEAKTRIDAELARWREIGRALQIVEAELFQVVVPGSHLAMNASPDAGAFHWSDQSGHTVLSMLTVGGDGTVDRVTFRQVEDRLLWFRHADAVPASFPEEEILLEQVGRLQLRSLHNGQWHTQWPLPESQTSLPSAIEVRLDLSDLGTIVRTYALR